MFVLLCFVGEEWGLVLFSIYIEEYALTRNRSVMWMGSMVDEHYGRPTGRWSDRLFGVKHPVTQPCVQQQEERKPLG